MIKKPVSSSSEASEESESCKHCIDMHACHGRYKSPDCPVMRAGLIECPYWLELEVARFQNRLLKEGGKGDL